jgi:hypothetical protein
LPFIAGNTFNPETSGQPSDRAWPKQLPRRAMPNAMVISKACPCPCGADTGSLEERVKKSGTLALIKSEPILP